MPLLSAGLSVILTLALLSSLRMLMGHIIGSFTIYPPVNYSTITIAAKQMNFQSGQNSLRNDAKSAEQDDGANRPQRGCFRGSKIGSITNMPEPHAAFSGRQLIFTFG